MLSAIPKFSSTHDNNAPRWTRQGQYSVQAKSHCIYSASFAFFNMPMLQISTVVHCSYLTKRIAICCLNHRSSVPATSSIAFLKLLSFGKSISSCFLDKFNQLVLNSSPLYFLFIPDYALHTYLIRHHDQAVNHFRSVLVAQSFRDQHWLNNESTKQDPEWAVIGSIGFDLLRQSDVFLIVVGLFVMMMGVKSIILYNARALM